MYDRARRHIPDNMQLVVPPLWDSNLSESEVSVNARMLVVRVRGFEAHPSVWKAVRACFTYR